MLGGEVCERQQPFSSEINTVSITLVSIIVFVAITLSVIAAGMWIRDLFFAGAGMSGAVVPAGRLRRQPTIFDAAPQKSLFGRIDQGFERLVAESGSQFTSSAFFLLLLLCAIVAGGILGFFQDDPLLGIGGAMVGLLLPLLLISIQRMRRMKQIREELPVVIDMIARTTRAGKSVDQTIELVAAEVSGPLGAEFRQCSRQLEMGRSFDKAVWSMASRVRLVEMQILATTLVVQRGSGGNLSETLDRMAAVVRDRLDGYRQMMAATGAGRVSTMIVASIGPLAFLFLLLLHRPHLQLMFDDPLGRLLLVLALLLEIAGLAWVFALLRSEE